MNENELQDIIRCQFSSDPTITGGEILKELLANLGVELDIKESKKNMSIKTIISTYKTYYDQQKNNSSSLTKTSSISMQIRKRQRKFTTIQQLKEKLINCHKILCIVGAGISASAGIPDFRSKDGIYAKIKETSYQLLGEDPRLIFDETQFLLDSKPFYNLISTLFGEKEMKPTKAHEFLFELEQQNRLLRVYTQNIDGLESKIGIKNVIYCHGNVMTSTCLNCFHQVENSTRLQEICNICQIGKLKPNITFFGQDLPIEYTENIETDMKKADLVLILGSSLKVNPIASLISRFSFRIPMVLINREIVGLPNEFDLNLLGETDDISELLLTMLTTKQEKEEEYSTYIDDFVSPNTYIISRTNETSLTSHKRVRSSSLN